MKTYFINTIKIVEYIIDYLFNRRLIFILEADSMMPFNGFNDFFTF